MANLSNSSNLINKVNSKQDLLVSGTNIKTVNNASLLGSWNISIESWHDYSWETKTISSWAVTLWLRTIVEPNSNFTVNKPATLEDGMEYVLRCVNWWTAYTLTLWTWIVNDFWTDLTLHANHSDQFTFVAVDGTLELQPEYKLASDSEVDDTAYTSSWNWVTNVAPSKNAVYDKLSAMDTTISGKADSSSLWTAATKNTWTSSWNVPVLDSNGKLNTSVLPAIAITDTFTVTNKSDLTWLSSAQKWDIAIVTSESKTYILSADWYSTASNWKELATPTDAVSSVNSKTWAVTLTTDDISVANDKNYVSTTEKTTWSGKQDALSSQTAYTSKWTASKVPQITTNSLWQVTWITEVNITYPTQVNDTTYWSSWDWVTTTAPSKNAVYDKLNAMDTTISWKADSSSLGTAATKNTWTSSWNVPVLDSNGKLVEAIMPAWSLTVYCTQSEYDALPSSKTSDGKVYMIYTTS